jgi:hypothetical protein
LAYGVGEMKPDEFWDSTPGELVPYLEARAEYLQNINHLENQRIGLICSVIQSGVPVGFVTKTPKQRKPDDYFSNTKSKKSDDVSEIYNAMQSWCKVSGGGK